MVIKDFHKYYTKCGLAQNVKDKHMTNDIVIHTPGENNEK